MAEGGGGLFAFGFGRNKRPAAVLPEPPNPQEPSAGKRQDRGKHRAAYDPKWKEAFPWHEKREDGMYCSLCLRHNQHSLQGWWTKKACTTMRREALNNHAKGEPHLVAVQLQSDSIASTSTGGVAQSLQKAVSIEQMAFLAAVRSLYWLCKNEIPHTTNYASLLDLQKKNGCSYISSLQINKRTNYSSEQVKQEIVLCIGDVLKNEKLLEIKESPFYATLCDETTDISIAEQFILYIKYLDVKHSRTKVSFLSIDEVKSCESEVLTRKLQEVLVREQVPPCESRMAGFGSDGAANMVGRLNGVAARLKRVSPILVSNHCVAHRLALAVGSAASAKKTYIVKFNSTLESLYYFYENSTIRTAALKSIQEALDEKEGERTTTRTTRPKRARTTRWLSHDEACKTMSIILPAVIISLQREATERGDPKALGLDRLVEDWRFVACLYFMLDILPQLSILSKCFQESALDFGMIHDHVNCTLGILQARLVIPGDNFKRVQNAYEEIRDLANPNMHMPTEEELADFKAKVLDVFVKDLISNITERFPHVGLFKALTIFDPRTLPENEEHLDEHGLDLLPDIIKQYERIVDEGALETEWRMFRHLMATTLKETHRNTSSILLTLTKASYAEVYPNLNKVAAAALVIPMSTADCERGFSALKRIKTRLRASLTQKVLNALMFIATEGPEFLSEDQLTEVLRRWKGLANRQITISLPPAPTIEIE